MNTNWNLYRSFVAVYETRNIHRAADALGISHSAVWQNLKTLGDQLGFPLFTATRAGVTPTGESVNLYPQIKTAIDTITNAEINAEALTPSTRATIRIAATDTLVLIYLKDFMAIFCAQYPHIKFEFTNLNPADIAKTQEIDFVCDTDAYFVNTDWRAVKFAPAVTPCVTASRDFLKKHNLGTTLTVAEINKYHVISSGLQRNYNIYLSINTTINSTSLVMTYLLAKAGIGFGGYSCKEFCDAINDPAVIPVTVRDVVFPPVSPAIGWFRPLSKPARVFIDQLTAYCKTRFPA